MRKMVIMEKVLNDLSKCIQIKICPYCRTHRGKLIQIQIQNSILDIDLSKRKKYQVGCTNCGARGPHANSIDDAVCQYDEISDIVEKYDHLKGS
jgi:hypothetical protein